MIALKNITESKWYSRKFVIVILGGIAMIFFPDAQAGIATIVGIFCGSNVAQKLRTTTDKINSAVMSVKEITSETTKTPKQ
jgi:hypothetical protein